MTCWSNFSEARSLGRKEGSLSAAEITCRDNLPSSLEAVSTLNIKFRRAPARALDSSHTIHSAQRQTHTHSLVSAALPHSLHTPSSHHRPCGTLYMHEAGPSLRSPHRRSARSDIGRAGAPTRHRDHQQHPPFLAPPPFAKSTPASPLSLSTFFGSLSLSRFITVHASR